MIPILTALRSGSETVLFKFSFLHHILVWEPITKFLQKGIFKQFLTVVELTYFTLFFTSPRWLRIKKISGPLLLTTLFICIIIYPSVICVSHQLNTLPVQSFQTITILLGHTVLAVRSTFLTHVYKTLRWSQDGQ